MYFNLALVIKGQGVKDVVSLNIYFNPFRAELWIAILAMTFFTPLVIEGGCIEVG